MFGRSGHNVTLYTASIMDAPRNWIINTKWTHLREQIYEIEVNWLLRKKRELTEAINIYNQQGVRPRGNF